MQLDQLELKQIRLLAELVDARNLAAAAAKIQLSPSAASHSIARLRKVLNDPLFIPGRAGLRLTPYGERLALAAQKAVETLALELAPAPVFHPKETTRQFTIILSEVGQLFVLPKFLAFLSKEAPKARLRVRSVPLETPGTALASGAVDLAIGSFDNLTDGFQQTQIGEGRYTCVVRANHPLCRDGLTEEVFWKIPHAIADSSGMAAIAQLQRTLERMSTPRHIRLVVPELAVLVILAAHSDLLVISPAGMAEMLAKHLPIQLFPPPVSLPTFAENAYWHQRYHRDPANRWLRQAIVRLFRPSPSPNGS